MPAICGRRHLTAREVFIGFALSLIVGVALRSSSSASFGSVAPLPLVVFFQTVPKVALAPIFILWFVTTSRPRCCSSSSSPFPDPR